MTLQRVFFLVGALFALHSGCLTAQERQIAYEVTFSGVDEEETELLRSASQLIALKDRPPKSEASLRRRADKDIPYLVSALHSVARYNAQITYDIHFDKTPAEINFSIIPGPVYPISSVQVFPEHLNIPPECLEISLNQPAYPADILHAESQLLVVLERMGYPLAKLEDRKVIADQESRSVRVEFYVDPGPQALFGKLLIEGNECVKEDFIKQKVRWKYGEIYDPCKVDETLLALESAAVFSSISITHAEEADEKDYLPITIRVEEGNQRSIGLGVGYSTQRGPGFTAEWEHRNFRGRGEKLRASANALTETQEGMVSYLIPDFQRTGQDLIYAAEVEHDDTKGYEKTSFAISGTLERQLSRNLRISYGGMYEFLRTTNENKDGRKDTETYNLARIPMKARWSNVDDPLDPCRGMTVFMKAIPTTQLVDDPFIYTITMLTASIYKPLSRENRLILAARAQFGSVWGASRNTIPGPDRFYAGSENTLRGYNYMTVSPLSDDADPIGGRSLMVYNLEARFRVTENWGTVLFYDIGNVFTDPVPKFNRKLLQSAGVGLRYYTPVGPLRLDVAFPLDRRTVFDKKAGKKKTIDRPYQIYFSVGQSF